jgi:hypothetical protein
MCPGASVCVDGDCVWGGVWVCGGVFLCWCLGGVSVCGGVSEQVQGGGVSEVEIPITNRRPHPTHK